MSQLTKGQPKANFYILIFRFKPYGKDNNKFARQPGEDGGERTVWAV